MGGMPRGGPAASGGFMGGGGAMRGAFVGPGGGRPAVCYKCGGPNHFARDCQAQAMKCYACGKLGHISRDCTAPNGGPLNTVGKSCYKCGQPGHIIRDCPQNAPAGAAVDGNVNGEVGSGPVEVADPAVVAAAAPVPAVS